MSNESIHPQQFEGAFLTAGKYHFRSTTYKDNLAQSLVGLFGQDKFSDVVLCVRDTSQMHLLKTHRFVLAHASQYFAEIFDQLPQMVHSAPFIIVLPPEITESVMSALLVYMYKGEVSVESGLLSGLVKAGKMLKVRGFEDNQNLMLIDCPTIKIELPDAMLNPTNTTSPKPVAPKPPIGQRPLPTVEASSIPAQSASPPVTSESPPNPAFKKSYSKLVKTLAAHNINIPTPTKGSVTRPPAGGTLKVVQSTKLPKVPIRFAPSGQTKIVARLPQTCKRTAERAPETNLSAVTNNGTTSAAASAAAKPEVEVKREILSDEEQQPGSSEAIGQHSLTRVPSISIRSGNQVLLYKCLICLTFFSIEQWTQHVQEIHCMPPLKKFKPHETVKR